MNQRTNIKWPQPVARWLHTGHSPRGDAGHSSRGDAGHSYRGDAGHSSRVKLVCRASLKHSRFIQLLLSNIEKAPSSVFALLCIRRGCFATVCDCRSQCSGFDGSCSRHFLGQQQHRLGILNCVLNNSDSHTPSSCLFGLSKHCDL